MKITASNIDSIVGEARVAKDLEFTERVKNLTALRNKAEEISIRVSAINGRFYGPKPTEGESECEAYPEGVLGEIDEEARRLGRALESIEADLNALQRL